MHLGVYLFETPQSLISIINKFTKGRPDAPLLSVTIPEGSTSFEIATLVAKALPRISIDIFGEMISKYNADGKLFPSTTSTRDIQKGPKLSKKRTTTKKRKEGRRIQRRMGRRRRERRMRRERRRERRRGREGSW